jgi:hypothetical protein
VRRRSSLLRSLRRRGAGYLPLDWVSDLLVCAALCIVPLFAENEYNDLSSAGLRRAGEIADKLEVKDFKSGIRPSNVSDTYPPPKQLLIRRRSTGI